MHRLVTISIGPGNRRPGHAAAPDGEASPTLPSGYQLPRRGPSPANAIRPDTATGDFVPSRSSLARPRAFLRSTPPRLPGAAEPFSPPSGLALHRDGTFLSNPPDPALRRAFFIASTGRAGIVPTRVTERRQETPTTPLDANAASVHPIVTIPWAWAIARRATQAECDVFIERVPSEEVGLRVLDAITGSRVAWDRGGIEERLATNHGGLARGLRSARHGPRP